MFAELIQFKFAYLQGQEASLGHLLVLQGVSISCSSVLIIHRDHLTLKKLNVQRKMQVCVPVHFNQR